MSISFSVYILLLTFFFLYVPQGMALAFTMCHLFCKPLVKKKIEKHLTERRPRRADRRRSWRPIDSASGGSFRRQDGRGVDLRVGPCPASASVCTGIRGTCVIRRAEHSRAGKGAFGWEIRKIRRRWRRGSSVIKDRSRLRELRRLIREHFFRRT